MTPLVLNLPTLSLAAAVVVNVCGILFIVETLQRRDEGAGRIWALTFLSAMIGTLAYLVWVPASPTWWAVALGDAASVGAIGAVWLGCRRFNERRMDWSIVLVLLAVALSGLAAALAGPDAGFWGGAVVMFCCVMLFGALGAVECLRDELGRNRTAWILAIVLVVETLFTISRTTAFLVAGPDSPVFETWFGPLAASLLGIALIIGTALTTSVLRAQRAPIRGYERSAAPLSSRDGVLSADVFPDLLEELCERAAWRGDVVAVSAVRIEDLDQISTAFGSETARDIRDAWRVGVRRHAPAIAVVAEDGSSSVLVATVVDSAATARRQAAALSRGLFDDLGAVVGGVIPVIGLGVATVETTGYDGPALVAASRAAAEAAVESGETAVVVSESLDGGSVAPDQAAVSR